MVGAVGIGWTVDMKLSLRLGFASLAALCGPSPSAYSLSVRSFVQQTRRSGLLVALADGGGSGLGVNIDGLRKESQRVLYRAQKKASKAEDRAAKCEAKQNALLEDENASLEDLEKLPPCDELRSAAQAEQDRLEQLEKLVSGLQAAAAAEDDGGDGDATLEDLVALAAELGVNDSPPVRPQSRPTKKKGPRPSQAPRTRLV